MESSNQGPNWMQDRSQVCFSYCGLWCKLWHLRMPTLVRAPKRLLLPTLSHKPQSTQHYLWQNCTQHPLPTSFLCETKKTCRGLMSDMFSTETGKYYSNGLIIQLKVPKIQLGTFVKGKAQQHHPWNNFQNSAGGCYPGSKNNLFANMLNQNQIEFGEVNQALCVNCFP